MMTLFIKRPVLTLILNAFLIVLGLVAYQHLGVAEYPSISVPKVKVAFIYPGASMDTIEHTIVYRLEDEVAGISGVNSVRSEIGNGFSETWITFRPGTSIEHAMLDVRDRAAWVKSELPREVLEPYVEQTGRNNETVMFLTLTGSGFKIDELTHFAKLHILNQLKSIQGVSWVELQGVPYVMKINLDRAKMAAHQIGTPQIFDAIKTLQAPLSVGKFQGEVPISLRLEPENPEDFATLPVTKIDDVIVTLGDLAHIELSQDTRVFNRLNDEEAVYIDLIRSSDGNPLEISKQAHELLPSLRATLPAGVKLDIVYDGATFVESSLKSLAWTILEACLLVLAVVYLFLRNWKATLIPMIAIPISLIGSLALVKAFGFSINTFSLLALVLAVGLVVDDAIVVVENIYRHLEKGLSAFDASIAGIREIAFSIVGMTLVLVAVFIPVALTGGLVGQILIQFGVTLAAAVLISGFVALSLSPLMCSRMLTTGTNHPKSSYSFKLKPTNWRNMALFLGAIGLGSALLYTNVPKRVVPIEDRGFMGVQIEPLPGATLATLMPYIEQVDNIVKGNPIVKNRFLAANDKGRTGVSLELVDYSKRNTRSTEFADQIREKLKKIPSVTTFVWNWNTGLPGFESDSAGAAISIAVKTTHSYKELDAVLETLQKSLTSSGVLTDVSNDLKFNFPSLKAHVDTHKMALLEVPLSSVERSLRVMLDKDTGSKFYKDGLKYEVWVKGAETADNLHEVDVLSTSKERMPLSTFVEFEPDTQPKSYHHYNRLRSANITAQLVPGKTLSDGIDAINKILKKELPSGYSYEYLGAAKSLLDSSNSFLVLLLLALIFIYGVLAIQFESFVDPLIILVTVPLAAFGALLAIKLTGNELNIFGQVGLVTLIGLISKHGILLVDFANKTGSMQQAIEMRLRPIIMTTAAMVLGALPLMFASGAGSEARRALGLVLVSGLIFGTFLTLWVVPRVYLLVRTNSAPSR